MKKIAYFISTFFLILCLTGCSFFDMFKKKETEVDESIIICYVMDKDVYKTYDNYQSIEFIDYTTKTGYEFVGWSKEINGSVITKDDLQGVKEIKLYPITKLIKYRIIYNLDGGINDEENPSTYTVEDEITLKTPTKDSYAFIGWTLKDGDEPVEEYKIKKGTTGQITLTANYIYGKVNVTFYGYEELNAVIDRNTKVTKPKDPEKDGDTFKCWCTDKSLLNEFDFDTLITESITLYPRFENTNFNELKIANSSYVKSNYENGALLPEGVTIILETNYVFENKKFAGWNVDGKLYSKASSISLTMPNRELRINPILENLTTYSYTKGVDNKLLIPVDSSSGILYGSNVTEDDYSVESNYLKLNKSYLDSLNLGLHSFVFNYYNIIYVYIKSSNVKVTNIKVDYDINYPYGTLIFDQVEGYNYSYSLDGSSYKSCNSYDTLTINNKYVGHSIDIKCDDTVTNFILESIPLSAKKYAEKTFVYQGEVYDYYVDSFEDLCTLIEYEALVSYPSVGGTSYTFYYYYPNGDKDSVVTDEYRRIINSIISIPYGLSIQYYYTKEVQFTLKSSGAFNNLVTSQTRNDLTEMPFKESNRSSTFNDFFIEKQTKTQEIRSVYELENLNVGIKPIIKDSKAQELYDEAKRILRNYVDDSFTVYEKLTAIYDYIGAYVTYDDALLEITTNQSDYASFTAYSALINGVAVCDGYASAFKLLCTIEGIECIEVVGSTETTGHAWNKVKIGGVWYGVDATWSRLTDFDYLRHDYFLVDESVLLTRGKQKHFEQGVVVNIYGEPVVNYINVNNTANNTLSYYDLMLSDNYDLVCQSITEFNDMVTHFNSLGYEYVEIKLDGVSISSVKLLGGPYTVYSFTGVNDIVFLVSKTA